MEVYRGTMENQGEGESNLYFTFQFKKEKKAEKYFFCRGNLSWVKIVINIPRTFEI